MAVTFPASLQAVGGARTGIAPVNLLDVQDVNGNYYWSDRKISAPSAIPSTSIAATTVTVPGTAMPWSPTSLDYPYGNNNGTAPVVALSGLAAGQIVVLSASGEVQYASLGIAPTPDGDPAGITGSTQVGGVYFPTLYMPGSKLGTGGLCGAFTDASGNVIEPLSIGVGGTFVVPRGASQIQLGINDMNFADNGRSFTASAYVSGSSVAYSPWLLEVPQFAFHRSLQTDIGAFVVQNLSGDTLSRDMEKTLRASALEGALFVYRCWQADAEAAWLEVHGTLTVAEVGVDTIQLKAAQLINPSQEDTPLEIYCETCQIDWAGKRCGSTQATECSYSFQTCQVVERIMVVTNNYEKNFGEGIANTALKLINRRRRI